jgi:MFS family permease
MFIVMEEDDKKNIVELSEKSRKYSLKEGVFSTIKDSVSGNYITPFAIAINSPNYLIGLLSSITGLIGPISEWRSSRLIGKVPRKKIVLTAVLFEILSWIPLILVALLYYYGIIVSLLPLMLLVFFSLYVISANAGSPAWFSWIGDLVDENKRGRWFGKRNAIIGFVTIISALTTSIILDFLKKRNFVMFGFIILFLIAMIARIISRYYLSKQYEPPIKIEKESYFSFFQFIKKAPKNNFGRFAIFKSLLNGAQAVGGPFFTVYLLKQLNFSYVEIIAISISTTLFTLISIGWWGKFSDKYGNYQVLRITLILVALCPIAYLFSTNHIYLILVPQILSGIGWGGFNLAASNYVFDCVTIPRRGLVLSYSDLLTGIGVFIGGITGVIIISTLNISFMNLFLLVFLISGILRFAAGLLMLPKIKEVKQKEKFSLNSLIRPIENKD